MSHPSSTAGTISYVGLLSANTILALAMPMLIILGGLAGLMLSPTPLLATFPASVQVFAALLATGPLSLLMGRLGRRVGFCLSGAGAALGAALCVVALMVNSFAILCAGHFILGGAMAGYQYFRFAAAEVVPPRWQPVAISLMLTSGLVAALAGPQLFIWTTDALAPVQFAGAYGAIALISLIGLVPLAVVRMPPLPAGARPRFFSAQAWAILRDPGVALAIFVGAVAQGIMIYLMAPTPLAMLACGFDQAAAGDVIRWHVVAMFAPSFFTGFIIQRFGAVRVSKLGLALLILSAVIAAAGISGAHFYGSLIVLGIGWNFSFIGATAMLTERVAAGDRAVVQGLNDTIIAFVSTICALIAGAVVTGPGWTVLAAASFPVLILAFVALFLPRFRDA